MNKQDLINKINESVISDLRKSEILKLINDNELDAHIIDQIKDIIQDDIDEDVSEILTDDQKKEIAVLEDEVDTQIKSVATEMADDMKFVEDETIDLEKMLATLNPVVEKMSIDKVKSDLDKVSA
jgi:predicted transcriptional regulator